MLSGRITVKCLVTNNYSLNWGILCFYRKGREKWESHRIPQHHFPGLEELLEILLLRRTREAFLWFNGHSSYFKPTLQSFIKECFWLWKVVRVLLVRKRTNSRHKIACHKIRAFKIQEWTLKLLEVFVEEFTHERNASKSKSSHIISTCLEIEWRNVVQTTTSEQ